MTALVQSILPSLADNDNPMAMIRIAFDEQSPSHWLEQIQ